MARRVNQSSQRRTQSPIVAEIVRRLSELYKPERIYLFGSVARKEQSPDSDYDFMVVVPDHTPAEVMNSPDLYKILGNIDVPIDVLVYPRDDFDKQLHLRASLPSTIVREGLLLYGA